MGLWTMPRRVLALWSAIMGLASLIPFHVSGDLPNYPYQMRKMQSSSMASFIRHDSVSLPPASSPGFAPLPPVSPSPRVYHVTSYGADATGKTDSTAALEEAIAHAFESGKDDGFLMKGILSLGGAQIHLEGGTYTISRPLRLPAAGRGNFMIHGGTLKASEDFPGDGYLIDLSAPSSSSNEAAYNFEYITLRDLMLDSNFRGGGIQVINSLRTSIDNCYISHFTTNGILVQSGHETYIRYSFLGQHITAGGDPGERDFSATAINLMGNDNAVTDVVIFSAAVGIMVSGQANIISGVHCYNKATGFGGTGIYLKLPGLTQTRIVNSYFDYTGIVAEDPVQLHISGSFFLGDAFVLFKSVNGVINGVNVVDNMFSGSGKGTAIVQLDQSNGAFKDVDQLVIDRNNVKGMNLKATAARGSVQGNGSSWEVDFNQVLLFPNLIKNVQYSLRTTGDGFPNHALRNVSANRVVIESDLTVPATVFVTVDQ
ncbi:polygalacturonase QRT3 [Diospyros lotus]|uniref:polygalacturonase QRT3 n=1 Tax=Diospyros lotus TaxID=55363 RepID=UPI00224EB31C|nr:polygalacturonase QRT3 [Diospyros lotus]